MTRAVEREALAGRLRARVAERRYNEAQCALNQYVEKLQEAAAGLPPGDPDLRRLAAEWQRVHGETRRQLLIGRAHAATRLARLPRAAAPYAQPFLRRRTWEVSG